MSASIDQDELNMMFSFLIGLPIKEAILIVGHNMSIREVIKEGEELPCDSHYKDNRINVEIKDKHIYRIISIG